MIISPALFVCIIAIFIGLLALVFSFLFKMIMNNAEEIQRLYENDKLFSTEINKAANLFNANNETISKQLASHDKRISANASGNFVNGFVVADHVNKGAES